MTATSPFAPAELPRADFLDRIAAEVHRRVVGQDYMIERLLIGMLTGGHVLFEGLPGLAKTLAVRTLAETIDATFQRIQFTPDLLPADVVGTTIYNARTGEFVPHKGPIFAHIVLADEVNRAPAKVQAALLEAMQERQVTIGGTTFKLPDPFMVLATQNPIEQEGTYPLPEAQVDRFMLKVLVDYPAEADELTVIERALADPVVVESLLSVEELAELQAATRRVYVDPAVSRYALAIATATRRLADNGLEELAGYVEYGASPRGPINLVVGARALALLRGRRYALPQDVRELAKDVLRHRLVLSYEALAEGVDADSILDRVLETIAMPQLDLARQDVA